MRLKPVLAALAVLSVLPGAAAAQRLVAWPIGGPTPWRFLLPGQPLPPRPAPLPHPRVPPAPAPVAPPDASPVTLADYRVEGKVEDQAADLVYHVRYRNPGDARLEGVFLMPIPGDAVLGGLTMTVSGKEMKGELLDAGQASRIYESIVRQARDPALLELVGERMVRVRVFPIEPRSHVDITLTLSQVLRQDGGLVRLAVPVRSARRQAGEGRGAAVRLRINASAPLRSLQASSAGARIERRGERSAEVSYAPAEGEDAGDLSIFYSIARDPLAAGVLAYRERGDEGFFMVSLSPRLEAGASVPKDIVFVVDRSGSMQEGGRMEQARRALKACLRRLSPGDRFGIVDFATDARTFEDALAPASPESLARAERYADGLAPMGGTNIGAALSEAMRLLPSEGTRLPMVFFLTDGLPTVGETSVEGLLRAAADARRARRARVFAFGVGSDVNTLLLDKLAEGNGGARDYVGPAEDIEAKLSGLYGKIASPALTDIRLSWEGLEAGEVFPRPVTDLFHGSDLVLLGRYRAPGRGRLVVTGRQGGRERRFSFPVGLPEEASGAAFLPKLWASRKVGHELDAVRLSGRTDPEVIDSIVKLAKRYGIVTPYTSYLITEDGMDLDSARRQAERGVRALNAQAAGSGAAGAGGMSFLAQKASKGLGALRGAAASPAAEPMAMMLAEAKAEAEAGGRRAVELRTLGGKTFYRRGQAWVDAEAELVQGAPETRIAALSAEYFELIARHPQAARWLALGGEVVVRLDGTTYRVRP